VKAERENVLRITGSWVTGWIVLIMHLRKESQGVSVHLRLTNERLACLRSSAGELAEGSDNLGMEGDSLAPDFVEALVSENDFGGKHCRGEDAKLGLLSLSAHGPLGGLWMSGWTRSERRHLGRWKDGSVGR